MNAPRPLEILGGGLSGLSLALALRRAGAPVTLHEAGDYPRHRVCGELITSLDDKVAAELGLAPLLADAHACTHVRWLHRDRLWHRQPLPTPARAISRHRLDARLATAFRSAGGKLHTRSRREPPAATPGIVRATGRERRQSPWVGLKCHARGLDPHRDLEMHLGHLAYVGLCPVEDGWTNVCGLFHRQVVRGGRDPAVVWPATLERARMPGLARRMAGAEIRDGSFCSIAGFGFDARPIAATRPPGELRLGDAAAMIPPFTGNGMTIACLSAAAAVAPLLAWSRRELDWNEAVAQAQAEMEATVRVRLRTAALLHPFLLQPAARRCFEWASRLRLVPFRRFYHLLH